MRLFLATILLFAGCRETTELFLEATWGEEKVAVVAVADQHGNPLGEPHIVSGSGPFQFEIPDTPIVVFAEIFSRPTAGGPNFHECGVIYGGSGVDLVPPEETLTATVTEVVSGTILLEKTRAARTLPLRHEPGCIVPLDVCGDAEVRPIRPQLQAELVASVAAVSEDLAFIGVRPAALFMLRSDDTLEPIELPELDPTGSIYQLFWDHHDTIYGYDRSSTFHLDRDGSVLAIYQPPVQSVHLSVGIDGTAVVVGEDGRAYRLNRGSIVHELIDTPPDLRRIFVHDQNRMAVIAETGVYYYDGSTWEREYTGGGYDRYSDFFGNDEILGIAGGPAILFRDETNGEWEAVSYPFSSIVAYDADVGQRPMVVGDSSGIAVWLGDSWCRVHAGLVSNFYDVDFLPDGRRALIAGGYEEVVVVVRVALP